MNPADFLQKEMADFFQWKLKSSRTHFIGYSVLISHELFIIAGKADTHLYRLPRKDLQLVHACKIFNKTQTWVLVNFKGIKTKKPSVFSSAFLLSHW